jgi:hypothetical protein
MIVKTDAFKLLLFLFYSVTTGNHAHLLHCFITRVKPAQEENLVGLYELL